MPHAVQMSLQYMLFYTADEIYDWISIDSACYSNGTVGSHSATRVGVSVHATLTSDSAESAVVTSATQPTNPPPAAPSPPSTETSAPPQSAAICRAMPAIFAPSDCGGAGRATAMVGAGRSEH